MKFSVTTFLNSRQLLFKRSNSKVRLISTSNRKSQKSSISELLSTDLLEETFLNQDDVDIEYLDIKERIEKNFKIDGVGSKLGIITLTSLNNSLPGAAAGGGGKVEIQFHCQHSKEEDVDSKKDGLSSADVEKNKSKSNTNNNSTIFSDNKLEMDPELFGMDTRVGISFVARIFQPSTQQIIRLDCFASENMFIRKFQIIPDDNTNSSNLSSFSSSSIGDMASTSCSSGSNPSNGMIDLKIKNIISIGSNRSVNKFKTYSPNRLYTAEFRLLNKSLQRSIYRYLSSTWHIGDDVNFFVLACSRQKEQQLYMNWLDKLCLFTAGTRDMTGGLTSEGKSSRKKRRSSSTSGNA